MNVLYLRCIIPFWAALFRAHKRQRAKDRRLAASRAAVARTRAFRGEL